MAFQTYEAVLPAVAASGSSATTILGAVPSKEAEGAIVLSKMSLTSPSTVTGQATNYCTFTFRQLRAGASVATLGTFVMSAASVVLTAEVETDVTIINATPQFAVSMAPGDVIDVVISQTASGLAVPAGVVAKVELA